MAPVHKAAVEQFQQEVLVPGLAGEVLSLEPGIDLLGNELGHKMVLLLADRIEMPVQLGDIEIAQQLGMDGELVEPPAPVVDGNGDALIPGAVVLVLVPARQGRHKFQGDISPLHSMQPGFIRRGEGGGMGDDIAGGGDDHQGASQVMGSPVGDPVQLLSIQRGLDQFPFELFIHSGSSLCCQPKISFTF